MQADAPPPPFPHIDLLPHHQVALLVEAAANSSSQIILREAKLAALMQKTALSLQAQLSTATAVGSSVNQVRVLPGSLLPFTSLLGCKPPSSPTTTLNCPFSPLSLPFLSPAPLLKTDCGLPFLFSCIYYYYYY